MGRYGAIAYMALKSTAALHGRGIDDYAKDGRPGAVLLLCNFSHDSLRA